ncbi:class I SAM-dependent methyltransferase [Desulfonatronovibrio magnus]|uniref:class I SAM-dependent methyltransferase n=1 Tax=Desulfonatronovibrio magnus TaxID=698827 RepID=UPI0005EB93C6|nr:class I SAM-dependent methyltransferase [Desulfonatronovibrio magnus]
MQQNKKTVHNPEYDFAGYDHKRRFMSYWYQIREIVKLSPGRVLEIGIGSGQTSAFLRSQGLKVVTMDIDQKLKPDLAGSCMQIPLRTECFDVVACFQVLEHLPFEYLEQSLEEIHRITRQWAVLSLPDASRALSLTLKAPGLKNIEVLVPIPWPVREHHFDGEHFWEINKKGFGLDKVVHVMKKNFKLSSTFRSHENPYHRFFVLQKA